VEREAPALPRGSRAYRLLGIAHYAGHMRWIVVLSLAAISVPAVAQIISGHAVAVDGDTLQMTGERIRLFGIDAPEADQTCQRGGEVWRCGEDAGRMLASLVDGKPIECTQRDRDDYGRMVAVCRVAKTDLAMAMVNAGLAVVPPQFTADYVDGEAAAKARGVGLWGSNFAMPSTYRAAHPQKYAGSGSRARLPAPATRTRAASSSPARHDVYYRNCAAARAAGAAPLYRGQPGYRSDMDGDGDGIACEPYRRR